MPALRRLAEATPSSRDRYVDFLRAVSIAAVVVGHFFCYAAHADGRHVWLENRITHVPGLWIGTWLLQVMPVFFVVGGFSNATALDSLSRRGGGWRAFLAARAGRLLRPAGVFVAVWALVAVGLRLLDPGAPDLLAFTTVPFGPLWFLAVYLAVVALAPPMLRLHRRFGIAVPLVLLAGVACVDAARFTLHVSHAGDANLLLVWLFAHQLGFFWADGRLPGAGWRRHALLAVAAFALLVALVAWFGYPRTMFDFDAHGVSNQFPPTLAMAVLTVWLVGLAMLVRGPASRWLARTRPWTAVIAVNTVIMTVFLWHMTAYLLVIVAARALVGFASVSDGGWWPSRPLWLVVPLATLVPLVVAFGWAERGRLPRPAAQVDA